MYSKVETLEDIRKLAVMAEEIWTDYFGDMFGAEAARDLVRQAQSVEAIREHLKEGYLYFFIAEQGRHAGYFSYITKADEIFLSKVYLYKNSRGKGLGKQVMLHLEDVCKQHKLSRITLTVNTGNSGAIKAYEKWGFENKGLTKKDFGNGMVFDDYFMQKIIQG